MALELPPQLRDAALLELNERPEAVPSQLQALRDSLGPALAGKLHRADDPYLLMFLRWAKHDVFKAKKRVLAMEKWLTDNSKHLGDISAISAESFREMYGVGFMSMITEPGQDGSMVTLMMPQKLKPGVLKDPSLFLKWNVYMLHRAVHDPHLQVGARTPALRSGALAAMAQR